MWVHFGVYMAKSDRWNIDRKGPRQNGCEFDQTTFSNAFSSLKRFQFRLRCQWTFAIWSNFLQISINPVNGLVLIGHWPINWTNVNQDLRNIRVHIEGNALCPMLYNLIAKRAEQTYNHKVISLFTSWMISFPIAFSSTWYPIQFWIQCPVFYVARHIDNWTCDRWPSRALLNKIMRAPSLLIVILSSIVNLSYLRPVRNICNTTLAKYKTYAMKQMECKSLCTLPTAM